MPHPSAPEGPIFLIGFMGSGKTTVGKLVAERSGWAFADLDDLVVRAAGLTVAEIFAREGEEGFRRRETEAVRAATAGRRSVVATGGGAACREENLALMLSSGRVVALAVSAAEAVRRTGSRSGRPLLDGSADPLAAATALLAARQPFYRRAHLRVETDGRTLAEVADEIAAGLALGTAATRESA
ncbi:MAG TPA: shikimate kinase [Polyangia bacterium]|jgi:shikimate kinase|nr:shikimate kinase [Polyangia bacterium]